MRYVIIIFPGMVDRNKIEGRSRWLEFGIWNEEFGNPAQPPEADSVRHKNQELKTSDLNLIICSVTHGGCNFTLVKRYVTLYALWQQYELQPLDREKDRARKLP
jgi:hypothetical protein